ncbi:MAG: redoxin domain-containing protein [Bacteroidia bacterium]
MTKIRLIGFLVALCVGCGPASQQADLKHIGKIKLQQLNGQHFSLADSLKSLNVVYFFAPECPLSENYCLAANLLAEKAGRDKVMHLAVVPGNYFSAGAVLDFARRFQLEIPIVRDTSWQLSRQMRARVTPEVVIFDQNERFLYQGAIDNWVFELGKKRQHITHHYADTVLMSALNGSPLPPGSTKAIGCFIEYPN